MTGTACRAPSGPSPSAPVPCCFCGKPEVVELFEIWGHEFMWETCCPSLHESLCQQVADDPAWGRELLRRIGVEALAGHQLRRLADDGAGGLVLDWQLRVQPIAFKAACAFVRAHHAHCGTPVTARFSLSAHNGGTLLGVFYRVVASTYSKQCPQAFVHESPTYGVIPVDSSVASFMRRMVCRLVLNSRAKADTPAPSSSRCVTLLR